MSSVYKHNTSGKYLKFENWDKKHVDDITDASIFDDDDIGVPLLIDYEYINYEKELRKMKLQKLNENR